MVSSASVQHRHFSISKLSSTHKTIFIAKTEELVRLRGTILIQIHNSVFFLLLLFWGFIFLSDVCLRVVVNQKEKKIRLHKI